MAAEAARRLDYEYNSYYGSAVPSEEAYDYPPARRVEAPIPEEQVRPRERAATDAQRAPAVSMFAVFGAVFAGILMIFVVLGHISYSEIAGETARLETQMDALNEQQKRLEIEFESVIDMKEIERYARDTLGMSRSESDQSIVTRSTTEDRAEIVNGGGGDDGEQGGFGSFISSLLDNIR